jgi:hypothetical protein
MACKYNCNRQVTYKEFGDKPLDKRKGKGDNIKKYCRMGYG